MIGLDDGHDVGLWGIARPVREIYIYSEQSETLLRMSFVEYRA